MGFVQNPHNLGGWKSNGEQEFINNTFPRHVHTLLECVGSQHGTLSDVSSNIFLTHPGEHKVDIGGVERRTENPGGVCEELGEHPPFEAERLRPFFSAPFHGNFPSVPGGRGVRKASMARIRCSVLS